MEQGTEAKVRVVHRHRIGKQRPFVRISELSFNGHAPVAILTWLNEGETRTPGVCIELDPAKLHLTAAGRRVFFYEGVTSDPRFD